MANQALCLIVVFVGDRIAVRIMAGDAIKPRFRSLYSSGSTSAWFPESVWTRGRPAQSFYPEGCGTERRFWTIRSPDTKLGRAMAGSGNLAAIASR